MRSAFGLPALRPVQRQGFDGAGPPLIVGGTGDRVLDIAAQYADIVSVASIYQVKGEQPGKMRLGTAAEADERVRHVREATGARADRIEWHALVQSVVVTEDRGRRRSASWSGSGRAAVARWVQPAGVRLSVVTATRCITRRWGR